MRIDNIDQNRHARFNRLHGPVAGRQTGARMVLVRIRPDKKFRVKQDD